MRQKVLFIAAASVLLLAFLVGAWVYKSGKSDAPASQADPAKRIALPDQKHLVRMHAPTLGRPDAAVQIVEFLDPACGACRVFYPRVKSILDANPDDVRLVLRFAPFHRGVDEVVAVLNAASRQGKFWPALEALLNSQAQWAPNHTARVELVWKHLEGLDLDFEQLRTDMASPEIRRSIAQDIADVRALQITKTPTFFVNGQPLPSFGYEQLKNLVDEALRASGR